jgi:hypothetical protein
LRIFSLILILIGALACSTEHRTPYQKFHKDKGGYRDAELADDIHVSDFEANQYTKRSYAEMFARYHSLENCRHEGQSYSHILAVIDKTTTKTITRTNADYWGPSYYYGMSPYYSRYGGFGWSTGLNFVNGQTWQETLIFPEYEVIYHCANKVYEPMLAMRDVPPEELKLLVKDLKGGVQVEKVLPGSPNKEIKENDVILKANGHRITKGHQLLSFFLDGPKSVKVELLRDGVKKEVTVKGKEVTEEVQQNLSALKNQVCDFKDVKTKSKICGETW